MEIECDQFRKTISVVMIRGTTIGAVLIDEGQIDEVMIGDMIEGVSTTRGRKRSSSEVQPLY